MTLVRRLVLSLGLLGSPALADPAHQIATASAWTVFESTDEKSNLRSYVATTIAESGGDKLQVSCHPPSPMLDAILNSETVLGSGYRSLAYRVDENDLVSFIVAYSPKLVELPRSFLDDVRTGKSIVVQLDASTQKTVERRFSLDGFREAVAQLRKYCPEKATRTLPPGRSSRRPPQPPAQEAGTPALLPD